MEKVYELIWLVVFLVFVSASRVFALEDDTLYKYVNFDACLSVGETQTYDRNDNKRGMVSIGGIWNFSLGLQYNRLRGELAYQERAEVSEIVQTMLGLVSTMTVRAAMANFYYDYVRSKHFAMYLGTGIGADYYELSMKSWTDLYEDSGYSCILGGYTGLTFIIKQFSIDLGFNYYYITKPETNTYAPKISFRYAF